MFLFPFTNELWGQDTIVPAPLDSLIQRSRAFTSERNYTDAFATNARAFRLAADCCTEKSAAYAAACFNEGRIHHIMGDYEKAVEWYLPSMRIRKQVLGPLHEDYGKSLNNLAVAYKRLGRFESAEPLYRAALRVRKELFGENSKPYAATLGNLAVLYRELGNLEDAESLNLKAKNIREELLGTEHPHYAISLINLAALYYETYQLDKAEDYYLRVKKFYEDTDRVEDIEYLFCLDNLGALYMRYYKNETAESYYLQALEWAKKHLSSDNEQRILIHNHLGVLYTNTGRFDQARIHFNYALDAMKSAGRDNHHRYGFYQQNLANLFFREKSYSSAKKEQLASLQLIARRLGTENDRYRDGLRELVNTEMAMKEYDAADVHLRQLANIARPPLKRALRHMSEKELADYVLLFAENLNYYFTLAERRPELADLCFDEILLHRGFLLSTALRINQFVPTDSVARDQMESLRGVHRRIAEQYTLPLSDRSDLLDLEEKASQLEKKLARELATLGNADQNTNWSSVQARLNDDEYVIEFVRYDDRIMDGMGKYGALLLSGSTATPRFIPLCSEEELNQIIDKNTGSTQERINALYANTDQGARLYDLIWRPIQEKLPTLAPGSQLHIVKAGSLHRLNLNALPAPGGLLLGDQYQLALLTSSRELLGQDFSNPTNQDVAALFGGIDYDASAVNSTFAESPARSRGLRLATDSLRTVTAWRPLPWTEVEVYGVADYLEAAGFKTMVQTQTEANEATFKLLGAPDDQEPSPRLLHLATHGYFFPDPGTSTTTVDNTLARSSHPMIRSGLILAGANGTWTGRSRPPGLEDGVLTAYEVSRLDLRQTELVVLSACETGLGEVRNYEGVYGLQRAFRIAGSRYLMMALWQIPDYETQVFMDHFYQFWLTEKQAVNDAFRNARRAMREEYPEAFYWAGYVLLE